MALSRDFREIRAGSRPPSATQPSKPPFCRRRWQAILDGEVAPGLILLRDCINANCRLRRAEQGNPHPREKA